MSAEKKGGDRKLLIAIALALGEVWEKDMAIPLIKSRCFRRAGELLRATVKPTPDAIRAFYGRNGRWRRDDWRGRKGDKPSPEIILETWSDYAGSGLMSESDDRKRYISGEYAAWIKH